MFRFQCRRRIHLKFPSDLKGRTQLDRDRFQQTIEVPSLVLPIDLIESLPLKKNLLSLPKIRNIVDLRPVSETEKRVLLDPDRIKTKNEFIEKFPATRIFAEKTFELFPLTLKYENLTVEQVIKAVLPDDLVEQKPVNSGSSYSLIGHIAHFNLREQVLPFKQIFGLSFV